MKKIEIEKLSFGYSKNSLIFENLSLEINNDKGKIVGLMGDSGCGKSTMLKLILGILSPTSGKLSTDPEKPVNAYIPQEPILFEHLSPLANAKYFAKTKYYKKRFDKDIFEELKDSLNLNEVLEDNRSVLKLSGGQKQRLALLQALSIKPDFLLLDEPTTGLDSEVKLQFLNKLKYLKSKYNLLVIYVTHNKTEAEIATDEIVYIPRKINGAIRHVFHEKTADFIKSPPLIEAISVFKYPTPNIIELKNIFESLSLNVNDKESLTFIEERNMQFSNDRGLIFKTIDSNQVFTTIELLESKQQLTLHSHILNDRNFQRINFVGNIPIYKNGILEKKINHEQ